MFEMGYFHKLCFVVLDYTVFFCLSAKVASRSIVFNVVDSEKCDMVEIFKTIFVDFL